MNSFHIVPRSRFAVQLLVPSAVVFCLGVVTMGWVADPKTFRPDAFKTAQPTAELPQFIQDASHSGMNHWRTMFYFSTHVPEVCWGDNAVNDFQKKQCGEFWDRMGMGMGLGFLPWGVTGLFFYLAMGSLETVYRRGRKRVASGKAMASGTVTHPAGAPGDLFSRVYCFRTIGVELPGGKQLKVYSPIDAPMPLPGLKMAVFEPVTLLGEPRHFAIIYAPHVAVVSGVRRA